MPVTFCQKAIRPGVSTYLSQKPNHFVGIQCPQEVASKRLWGLLSSGLGMRCSDIVTRGFAGEGCVIGRTDVWMHVYLVSLVALYLAV